jgi:E3 ubiquitin-protein ligase BRE1
MCNVQTESSLCSELDRLSAAWEALDRQVKQKVFDLTAVEEKLSKWYSDVSFRIPFRALSLC